MDKEAGRERIQERAYQLYLARGGAPGGDREDWLQAEKEIEAASSVDRVHDRSFVDSTVGHADLKGNSSLDDRKAPGDSKVAPAGENGREAKQRPPSKERRDPPSDGHSSNGAVPAQGRSRRARGY